MEEMMYGKPVEYASYKARYEGEKVTERKKQRKKKE
jgi:hypothetical protein